MDAVLYLRFSTDEQADGTSEQRQTDAADPFCKRERHDLIRTYADRGISGGKSSRQRKGLANLLEDLANGPQGCGQSHGEVSRGKPEGWGTWTRRRTVIGGWESLPEFRNRRGVSGQSFLRDRSGLAVCLGLSFPARHYGAGVVN